MRDINICSNGGSGALFITKEPITGCEIISLGLNNKQEVLSLYKKLDIFIKDNYNK